MTESLAEAERVARVMDPPAWEELPENPKMGQIGDQMFRRQMTLLYAANLIEAGVVEQLDSPCSPC